MKKTILNSLFLLCFILGYGQELPTIVPPSPEATSLAKFTDIPVSHYTGLPTIGVPLHEIDFDGLKIPISLSYHARGIKVEEIASRVGLGWALNAGGIITRQKRGNGSRNDYFHGNFYKNFEIDRSVRASVFSQEICENKDFDLYPDIFIFNFLGYSGKFIFDQQSKEAVLQSFSDLKISRKGNSDNDYYFVITNERGFQFYFGKSENSTNPQVEAKSKDIAVVNYKLDSHEGLIDMPEGLPFINTWHLVEIVSPYGKKSLLNMKKKRHIFTGEPMTLRFVKEK